jgi:hypothetical protein
MSSAADRIDLLFGSPGSSQTSTKELLHQAAKVHAELFTSACTDKALVQDACLGPLLEFLESPSPRSTKRRLLCHPLFIEGLHTLAPASPILDHWHQRVTTSRRPEQLADRDPTRLAALGHVTLIIRLNFERDWTGQHLLCTDVMGRLAFPFSDWILSLCNGQRDFLGSQTIALTLEESRASWCALGDATPFLIMSRDDCLRMILDNADPQECDLIQYPHSLLKPQLTKCTKLGLSRIRYDPVGFLDFESHAGLTGSIIARLLAAIQCNAPAVYHELCGFIHSIRGFELPTSTHGVFGSFSDPSIPGVIGINISYSPDHQPCLDPFCFTWFGHEMGHTKNYLIDTILHAHGQMLVRNPAELTEAIPRYGRALTFRTLVQVPYVHLYEWSLLMDFLDADFRALPWQAPLDVEAVGDDFAAEIEESFDLIEHSAQLTPLGEAAVTHFHHLLADAKQRWMAAKTHVHHPAHGSSK